MKYAVLADKQVRSIGDEIAKKYGAPLILFEGGEKNKTREQKALLEDALFLKGLSRQSTLIVVGGGVTTDIGGFIAATFCRGIPWICVPTSLLAMVDASIGGKTGVDTPFGKNLIGAFHPPEQIIINLEFLRALPKKEIRNGLVEMIKHGLIRSREHFDLIRTHLDDLFEIKPILAKAIEQSIAIKQKVVDEDQREQGISRHLLNFGHTVGHAIETESDYKISHGEAVGIGILAEIKLAGQDYPEVNDLFKKLDIQIPKLNHEKLWQIMLADKKTKEGVPQMVKLKQIGEAESFLVPIDFESFKKI
jgi:3-dehydroquinate synthase